ncbi:MAG: phosphatidylserine decarboxylase family protein [Planctomycetia bacterium]|nr:phosphatidylserine decarboxylase family protein [Planctomycetia bacterium]
MATATSPPNPALKPVPITSAQPGGGTCMAIELAWGRVRRAVLRTVRPGYVRRMAALRQGDCPNCPHEVIDSRDLKFYRNVCGYWFKPEDDAFRSREQLGLARMGLAEVICFSFLLAVPSALLGFLAFAVSWWFALPLGAVLILWAQIISFFRDPERVPPADPLALVSPADGHVTHIDEVADPDFPGGRAWRISIFLSVFDVHVNRLPRTGKVTALQYFPGDFLDARHPQCGVANEQLWLDLEDGETKCRLRVKQISGKIARRIVCWLKPGQEVKVGDRYGMIKFGSRTEVYLPADTPLDVQVKIGDPVFGGSTILARFNP